MVDMTETCGKEIPLSKSLEFVVWLRHAMNESLVEERQTGGMDVAASGAFARVW